MLPTAPEVSSTIQQLASMLGVAEQFQEDPDMYNYVETVPVLSDHSLGSMSPLSDPNSTLDGSFQNPKRRPIEGGALDVEEHRASAFERDVNYTEVDTFDASKDFQGGFALTPAHELQFPRGQDEGGARSGTFKEQDSQRRFQRRGWNIRNSITASPLILPTRVMKQRTKWSEQGFISSLPEEEPIEETSELQDELEEVNPRVKEGRKLVALARGVMRMLKFNKSKRNEDLAPSMEIWHEKDFDSDNGENGQVYDHQNSKDGTSEPEKKGWWRKNRRGNKMWASAEEYDGQAPHEDVKNGSGSKWS